MVHGDARAADAAHGHVALVDPTGTPAQTWAFAGAYPVKWVGPNLNAGSDTGATETLEIAHSGMAVV